MKTNYAVKSTYYNSGKESHTVIETKKEAGYEDVKYASNGFTNICVWYSKKAATDEVKRLKAL